MSGDPLKTRLLLVEDDEADIIHFRRLCQKLGLTAEILIARSGDEALERLQVRSSDWERCVIVTDLNMPGIGGHELIAELRSDPRLSSSVIFVVSTSDLPDDIERAYGQHVAGYIVKDEDGERLSEGVAMLSHYIRAVQLH